MEGGSAPRLRVVLGRVDEKPCPRVRSAPVSGWAHDGCHTGGPAFWQAPCRILLDLNDRHGRRAVILIGYARTSTREQEAGLEAQEKAL